MTAKPVSPHSRRALTQAIAVVLAILPWRSEAVAAPTQPSRSFEHGSPLAEFGYGDVTLAPGLQQTQLEQTHSVLMKLNEDSLLRPFRLAAGLPAPGNDMAGWYSAPRFLAETFGQWISALSRYYAATQDQSTREKIVRLVRGFSETIEPTGKIYERPKTLGPLTAAYPYDKFTCGLIDALRFANVPEAQEALEKATTAALARLPGKAVDFFDLQDGATEGGAFESYTLPENQFLAWQRGAGSRHLQLARQYLQDSFFDPLARGENVLARRHAYSHVNALCSAAKAYLVLGEGKYLKAAVNGFAFVEQQSFATGGWGPGETFLPRPAVDYTDPDTGETKHFPGIETLGQSILEGKNHFETPCGSYAHFKLTRYLLRITKDSRYGDSMERVMYNAALGVLPLNKFGNAFYQSQYGQRAKKAYFDGYSHLIEDEWPCCSGTLPQLAADYRISAYFRDDDGVYVNLFIPSTVRWHQGDVDITLTQSGQYPLADRVVFDMQTSRPGNFALRLRIPAWAQAPSIWVNGQQSKEPIKPGTFASIKREWKLGDRIELELPRKLELKAADALHSDLVALVYGSIVLFAISEDTPKVTREQLLSAKQETVGSEEWVIQTADGVLSFLPWWAIKDQTYFTYLQL